MALTEGNFAKNAWDVYAWYVYADSRLQHIPGANEWTHLYFAQDHGGLADDDLR